MFTCTKCESKNLRTEEGTNNNVGLYCNDCDSWIKWLGKKERIEFVKFSRTKQLKSKIKDLEITQVPTLKDCAKNIALSAFYMGISYKEAVDIVLSLESEVE